METNILTLIAWYLRNTLFECLEANDLYVSSFFIVQSQDLLHNPSRSIDIKNPMNKKEK